MPVWVLIIIASRDFIIVMWLIVSYMNHLEIQIKPNFLGKTTTVFQMFTIISLLLECSSSRHTHAASARQPTRVPSAERLGIRRRVA